MNFILAANFVRNMPWTHSWWPLALARGLGLRGHSVQLAIDGTEMPDDPSATYHVHVANPLRTHLGAHPGRLSRLVRHLRRSDPQAVVLSLTPLVAGDLWLPIEPSPLQVARRLIRDLRPVSLALELSHHPWLPFEAWAAWRAHHPRAIRLAFDPQAGAELLPRVTTLSQSQADAAVRASHAVRANLGVPADRTLAILSLPEINPRPLVPFLSLLARAAANSPEPLTIVAATARPHSLARLAREAGLSSLVPVTLTRSVHALLAASDLAIAPPAQTQPTAPGSTGRWIADAIALSVPIVAHADASGADLIQPPATLWRTDEELATSLSFALHAGPNQGESRTIPSRISQDRLLERLETLAALVRPDRSATVPSRAR